MSYRETLLPHQPIRERGTCVASCTTREPEQEKARHLCEELAMDEQEAREERTEDLIQVRRVTQMHAAWTEDERGAPGAFTVQLILDDGADEYILRPTAEDVDVLQALWARSENVTFDLARKVVMFSSITG
jgi:hypothetical protein